MRIWADFNARTTDDRVRLTTVGSARDVASAGAKPGSWTWLSDGEVRVGAVVEETGGGLVARVAWETAEDVVPNDAEIPDSDVMRALRELQALHQGTGRDYRRMLRVLPLAERRLEPGKADYIRSRAAQAFGYPELALLAIDDALLRAPGSPAFVYRRLDLLKTLDLDRAFEEARRAAQDPNLPAVVIAAFAGIYNAYARRLAQPGMVEVERALLELTHRFERSPGRDTAPASIATMVYVARGFAILHLSEVHMADRTSAIDAFNRAVAADPSSAEALAARGLETYPDAKSIRDLETATALGMPSFWPAYYLAHHYAKSREWGQAARFADMALHMDTALTRACKSLGVARHRPIPDGWRCYRGAPAASSGAGACAQQRAPSQKPHAHGTVGAPAVDTG